MAAWPRTVRRGPLKGQTYASRREYRTALAESRGARSEFQARNERARKQGYKNYYAQRKERREKKLEGLRAARVTRGQNVSALAARFVDRFPSAAPRQERIETQIGATLSNAELEDWLYGLDWDDVDWGDVEWVYYHDD